MNRINQYIHKDEGAERMLREENAPVHGWIKLIDTFGLAKGGLVVWLLGIVALSLNLKFYALALLSFVAAAMLVGYTLWWLPSRQAAGAGLVQPGTPEASTPRGETQNDGPPQEAAASKTNPGKS